MLAIGEVMEEAFHEKSRSVWILDNKLFAMLSFEVILELSAIAREVGM